MKDTTEKLLEEIKARLVLAADGDLVARYGLACFLRDLSTDTVNYSPDEYAECVERLGFSERTAQRWLRVANVVDANEFEGYKGIVGADPSIVFSWSHLVVLVAIKSPKSRTKHLKAWQKMEGKLQSVRPWEKYIQNIVAPKAEATVAALTPKRALAKLTGTVGKVSEILENIASVDITGAAEEAPDTVTELKQALLYVWTRLPEVAESLGIDLATLSDDEEELDDDAGLADPEAAEQTDEAGDDEEEAEDADDTEPEAEDAEPEDDEEEEEEDDEEEDEDDEEIPSLARRRVPAGTHKDIDKGPVASLDDAATGAITGPASNRRRGNTTS